MMEFKLIVLFTIFLMANGTTTQNPNKITRPTKSTRSLADGNRGKIRSKNRQNFRIVLPDTITTHRPRPTTTYISSTTATPTTPTSLVENYQSQSYQVPNYHSQNYHPEKYQTPISQTQHFQSDNYQQQYQSPNYESGHYQSQKYPLSSYQDRNSESQNHQHSLRSYQGRNSESHNYQPQKYQLSDFQNEPYKPVNYQSDKYQSPNYYSNDFQIPNSFSFENPSSPVNYVTEPTIAQSEKFNSVKNVKPVIISKKLQYPETVGLGSFDPIVSKSAYAIVTPKPVLKIVKKIVYSPANEVSHVTFSGANGKIFYKW